jgi:hypothetical protein
VFARIYSNYRLSVAAVTVQNLLEMHGRGHVIGRDAGAISSRLVATVYARNPALFDGKVGKRPHKFSVAAVALAHGSETMSDDRDAQLCYHLSLGTILLEITGNPQKYALSSHDHTMLVAAQEVYLANEL